MQRLIGWACVAVSLAACTPRATASADGRPPWDATLAAALPGKTILIGTTYRTSDGALLRLDEQWGTIKSADPRLGIEVTLAGTHKGERYVLPPQTSNVLPAAKGSYRLKSTDEVIVDPDYVSNWTVLPPDEGQPDHL